MSQTQMEQEARQAPEAIKRQLTANQSRLLKIGEKLRSLDPRSAMIIGRGSSDHAGVFGKYLIEIEAGIPTSSAAPSVTSVYNKQLKLKDTLVILISQSGRSPDILAQATMAKEAGAYCLALVNDVTSPIKDIVDEVIPLHAEAELSVAATKSYLCTLSALLQLTAYWTRNQELIRALETLPQALQTIIDSQPQLLADDINGVNNMVVLGRGFGYAVAKEMALKLKEVSSIHAEAFSSAEFLHGPVTLVEQGLAILNCFVSDESAASHQQQIDEVATRGADLVTIKQTQSSIHPRIAPLVVLQRFYLDVAALAVSRGFNPDEPKGLNKVTRTV